MHFVITTALRKIYQLQKRIKAIQGGTSAGKTIGILQILIDECQTDKSPTLTSVVSETMPHLKKGAMRDFINIMTAHGYFDEKQWNRTDFIYTFTKLQDGKTIPGSKLEFFSSDQPSKVRGPRRQRLFINECNNMPFETFEQLEVRTSDEIFLDWNPITEFWFEEEVLGKRDDVEHIIVNYRDNEGLPESIVKSIEMRKNRPGWFRVYGEGLLGEAEDRIYTGWNITLEEIPHEARIVRRWLDFGYTNDPAAIGTVYQFNDGYIFNEQTYLKGLSNSQIADIFLNLPEPKTLIIADNAEPKSIAEIKIRGLNIIPCVKGPDSVRNGIQIVQDMRISVTKWSLNIIKEYRRYIWQRDADNKLLQIPIEIWDHHMDGIRYVAASLLGELTPVQKIKQEREREETRQDNKNTADFGL